MNRQKNFQAKAIMSERNGKTQDELGQLLAVVPYGWGRAHIRGGQGKVRKISISGGEDTFCLEMHIRTG